MNTYFNNIEKFIFEKYINNYPFVIKNKIKYLLQNGKRLRPILCILFSNINNIDNIDNIDKSILDTQNNLNNSLYTIIYNIAISIELIHSLSLVLDDLPEMDNDSIRRDLPSFHIKYGIDYTNFFIYYIFKHIGVDLDTCIDNYINETNNYKNNESNNETTNLLNIYNDINTLFKKNMNLLIEGQYNDLEWNTNDTTNDTNDEFLKEKDVIFELLNINNDFNISLTKINKLESNIHLNMKKTSSLFTLSITVGYFLQLLKYNINYVNKEPYNTIYTQLNIFGNILGYMFQISDDLLDIESDLINNKPNICCILDKHLVSTLLKNGCHWLYINAKSIQEIMKSIEKETNIEKEKVTFNLKVMNEIIDKIENRKK